MKFAKHYFSLALAFLALSNCEPAGSTGDDDDGGVSTSCTTATVNDDTSLVWTSATSTIPVHVADPATTGDIYYTNEPLVAVTICSPGHTSTAQCQTIKNILLDTGSTGLRVFRSAIDTSKVNLSAATVNIDTDGVGGTENYELGTCAVFGSGADWGQVMKGDVLMGDQEAEDIGIHVIDIDYSEIPTFCENLEPDVDPCSTGFNGILGLGMFADDCGADCESANTNVNQLSYYACDEEGCFNAYGGTAVQVPTDDKQIRNPLASFTAAAHNNGFSLTFPNISSNGARGIAGTLRLGISAGAGNTPGASVKVHKSDPEFMNFQTNYDTVDYGVDVINVPDDDPGNDPDNFQTLAFIDSGSNGLFYPDDLDLCSSNFEGFYCEAVTQNLAATTRGISGTPSTIINFQIRDAADLFAFGRTAYNNLGGSLSTIFDWGLPFFFNRTVYVGLEGRSATFSHPDTSGSQAGPYWAY